MRLHSAQGLLQYSRYFLLRVTLEVAQEYHLPVLRRQAIQDLPHPDKLHARLQRRRIVGLKLVQRGLVFQVGVLGQFSSLPQLVHRAVVGNVDDLGRKTSLQGIKAHAIAPDRQEHVLGDLFRIAGVSQECHCHGEYQCGE